VLFLILKPCILLPTLLAGGEQMPQPARKQALQPVV
jgi:hypothetical protein